jgi:hypothetical protein
MAGGSDRHEVICAEVKRVCDFCFQEERIDRTFAVGNLTGQTINCMIDQAAITCRVVQRMPLDGDDNRVLVGVAITVPVTITAGTQTIPQTVTFLKQAVICAPPGTDVECQVTGTCLCFFDATTGNLNCTFNFCVVIQSKVTVRVLLPTLGQCAPKRCSVQEALGGCPPGSNNPCDCGDMSASGT